MRVAGLLSVVALLGGGLGPVGPMATPRAVHIAVLLPDGRVLVAGGCVDPGCESDTDSTELYDPAKRSFAAGPRLTRPRVGHVAVGLADGSVLVLGGWSGGTRTRTAEQYADGRFVEVGQMRFARGGFTATRLRDGRVLVAGGGVAAAELYDPRTRLFAPTGSLSAPREAHAAALLRDGRVLVVGGSVRGRVLASAELYDPRTGRFAPAGRLREPRHKHAAVTLRDGRVLLIGGSDERDFGGRYRRNELYDPRARTFRAAPPLREARFKIPDAAVQLTSGDVVVAGGRFLERFTPGGGFVRAGELGEPLAFSTATLLPGGYVLVTGGYDDRIRPTDRAWFYGAP